MRILFVTERQYLPQLTGGIEIAMHEFSLSLKNLGDETAVLSALSRHDLLGFWTWIKCMLAVNGMVAVDHVMKYPVYRRNLTASVIIEILKRFRPERIIVHIFNNIDIAVSFQRFGIPTAIHLHDLTFEKILEADKNLQSLHIICASKFIADRLRRFCGIDGVVILNPIDPTRYRVPYSGKKVVLINPQPIKGLEIGLKLAQNFKNIPFLFVDAWASRKDRSTYRHCAKNLLNIEWCESVADMRKIYRQARILIVPSQCEEGWGRVVSEAQVSGIPILASNLGGLKESVGYGGMLLPHDNFQAWRETLEQMYFDDIAVRDISKKAIQHATREEIQLWNIVRQYRQFIADMT
jgi:glycosyltransferase involved in cell wall biosynthesis